MPPFRFKMQVTPLTLDSARRGPETRCTHKTTSASDNDSAAPRRRNIIRHHQVTAAVLCTSMSLLFSSGAHAQGNPNLGRNLAAACTTCHGTHGASRDGMPALAGMPRAQMSVTLKAFRDGQRPATIMNQLAKGYSDAQIEAIATYFASQKPDVSGGQP